VITMPKFDIAELSAGLYEAALKPDLISAAMENIAQSLGCYSYHQMVLDTQTKRVTAGWTGDAVPDSVQAAYENHYIQLDQRPLQAFAAGVGQCFVSSDLISPGAIDKRRDVTRAHKPTQSHAGGNRSAAQAII
jgi:hypothetical protein